MMLLQTRSSTHAGRLTKSQPVGHPRRPWDYWPTPAPSSASVGFARALHLFGFARKIRINNHFINHQAKVNRFYVGSARNIQ